VSRRPEVGRFRPLVGVVVAAALAVILVACNANGSLDPGLLDSDATIVARDIAFQPADVRVTSGQPVTLTLDNRDQGVPHGLIVARDGVEIARADIAVGPGKVTLELPPLAPGAYQLSCPVHPVMTGTLTAAVP